MKLYLASTSKTRKDILNKVGLKHLSIPSNVEEVTTADNNEQYLINLSILKAKAVADKLVEGVIIGADSMICFNKK